MTDDPANSGLHMAHTPPENPALEVDQARAAKVGTVKATAEAAMAGLAEQLAGGEEPEQRELLLADPDEEFVLFRGPVAHVADIRDAAKRGRGRPAGSKNRASADLASYLLSMGYRDPALNLADLANADPMELAAELSQPYKPKTGPNAGQWVESSMSPAEALELIRKANAELLPYFHSKRPQEIKVDKRVLGVMMIGDMPSEAASDEQTIDITHVDAPR